MEHIHIKVLLNRVSINTTLLNVPPKIFVGEGCVRSLGTTLLLHASTSIDKENMYKSVKLSKNPVTGYILSNIDMQNRRILISDQVDVYNDFGQYINNYVKGEINKVISPNTSTTETAPPCKPSGVKAKMK